jgi:ribosomal protein S18 acetylase RimI-like enzyme
MQQHPAHTVTPLEESSYPWELFLLADPSRDMIAGYISGAVVLGACRESVILGAIILTPLNDGAWEIKNIAVQPAHQGHGIGKELIRAALDVCRERGAREVWIGTGNSSINQLALYQKMGFRIAGVDVDFFTRNYPEAIVENGIECRDMIRLVHSLSW